MVETTVLQRESSEAQSHQFFPVFRSLDVKPKSRMERLFSIFADVRAGEGATAFMMTANIFLLLGAYYLLKPVREALILSENGAEDSKLSSASSTDISTAW